MRFASIDIGSNAIRMLFEEVYETSNGPIFKKLSLIRLPVRLGEDAFLKGKITKEKEAKLISMAHSFSHLCSVFDVKGYSATATSAMRDSKNGKDIIQKIKNDVGIKIKIIPGEEEAAILYESIFNTGKINPKTSYMFIDVGGGSTEINFYVNGKRKNWKSFNIGTIRLKESIQDKNEWTLFSKWIKKNIEKHQPDIAVGTGGNINKIYKLCGLKNWELLTKKELVAQIKLLEKLSIDEMVNQYDIRYDRADVIVHGASIYERAMSEAGIDKMIVPKVGMPDGLIRRLYFSAIQNQSK